MQRLDQRLVELAMKLPSYDFEDGRVGWGGEVAKLVTRMSNCVPHLSLAGPPIKRISMHHSLSFAFVEIVGSQERVESEIINEDSTFLHLPTPRAFPSRMTAARGHCHLCFAVAALFFSNVRPFSLLAPSSESHELSIQERVEELMSAFDNKDFMGKSLEVNWSRRRKDGPATNQNQDRMGHSILVELFLYMQRLDAKKELARKKDNRIRLNF